MDDAQIALAVINTTYASQIGLTPAKDGIFVEDKDSPYVNLIVTREDSIELLDKNSLTPARATNSGLESKKPTQSRFFYVLIQTSFQMNSQLKIHTYYLPLHLHIR